MIAELKLEMAQPDDIDKSVYGESNKKESIEVLQNEVDEMRSALEGSFKATNYSIGGTDIFASRSVAILTADDFDECSHDDHNDCSRNARCFNTPGSFTCSCKNGYEDIGELSGRVCAGMLIF